PLPCVAVADVRNPFDVPAAKEEWGEQDPSERKPPALAGAVSPAGTQARVQRLLDRGPCLPPSPGDNREPERRQHRHGEPGQSERRGEVSLAERQERRG